MNQSFSEHEEWHPRVRAYSPNQKSTNFKLFTQNKDKVVLNNKIWDGMSNLDQKGSTDKQDCQLDNPLSFDDDLNFNPQSIFKNSKEFEKISSRN